MKKGDIKIGQRIVLTKEARLFLYGGISSGLKEGARGTIIDIIDTDSFEVLIEFDDYIDGHNGSGRGKYGHCWWFNKEDLIKIAKICKRKNNYYY